MCVCAHAGMFVTSQMAIEILVYVWKCTRAFVRVCVSVRSSPMCLHSIWDKEEEYVDPLLYPLSRCRGIAPLIAVEKPHQCQVRWFMSLNPHHHHLQLLSIRLYNIPPIVQPQALSSLVRPVSGSCPAHNHRRSSGVGGRQAWCRGASQIG